MTYRIRRWCWERRGPIALVAFLIVTTFVASGMMKDLLETLT